jgi:hypothetical protein
MAYDLTPLTSYVRFYLTVVTQLATACENLSRTHGEVSAALDPFRAPFAPLASPTLAAALDAPPSLTAAAFALWRPDDAEGLTGIADVYEVVGRFSFQGEDNKNLARVQALVASARNEIASQRGRLSDLLRLPGTARQSAGRIAAEETARAAAARAEKAAAFGPLADQVHARARQTHEATRAVPFPDLSSAETASDEYRKYAAKVDQVYQTCLPFLRKAIASLYAFVGLEPTATWPDALPLVREMPGELVTVPPADSSELKQAQASLSALGEEEIRLARARDEVAATLTRLEGEMAAALGRDIEIEKEIQTATAIVDFVTAHEQSEAAKLALASLEQQKAQRVQAAGEVWQRHQATEAAIKVLEEELQARTLEMNQLQEKLAAERGDEPVLFGKDEWRARVAGLDTQMEGLRSAYNQRLGTLNQLKIDMSAVSVQVQTEQAQGQLIDRQLADTRARLDGLLAAMKQIGADLGASRPARSVPLADAQQALGVMQQGRMENGQRIDRIKAEVRRQKEETVRVLTRMKQVGVERQQFQAMLQNAQVAATQGREEALRQLALQRRSAVERHVGEVLSNLEKSLSSVDAVFIDPAREAMLKATEPRQEVSAAVLEHAEKVLPVVERLARELEPALLSQDASLGQIQREFCDVAVDACKAAWG